MPGSSLSTRSNSCSSSHYSVVIYDDRSLPGTVIYLNSFRQLEARTKVLSESFEPCLFLARNNPRAKETHVLGWQVLLPYYSINPQRSNLKTVKLSSLLDSIYILSFMGTICTRDHGSKMDYFTTLMSVGKSMSFAPPSPLFRLTLEAWQKAEVFKLFTYGR